MMNRTFDTLGYEVVRNAISRETAELLALEFELIRNFNFGENGVDLDTVGFNNDTQTSASFAMYSAFCFEALMLKLLPIVEYVTGKKLYPTYSYARIYYKNAILERHTDRPSCQYSTTITLESLDDEPWDIWFKDFNGKEKPLRLNVTDMCVYRGMELDHWRQPYTGKRQTQAFLHYVDADDQYADHRYDRRKGIAGYSKY
jgi:hypothetical protein